MPSAPITYKLIHTNNAFLARQYIERYDATTNTYIPWEDGDAAATVSYYRDAAATLPITGLIDLPMEKASGEPGIFYFIVPSALLAAIVPYADQVIYQVVKAGATNNITVVTPLKVVTPRWAQ